VEGKVAYSITGGENLKKFLENVKKQKAKLEAGYFPESVYDTGEQVAQVAVLNHYGHVNPWPISQIYGEIIPARPFMQKAFDDHNLEWREKLRDTIIAQGENINVYVALKTVGFIVKHHIQETIDWFAAHGQDHNGPKVIKLKKSDSPLIWTGKMRDSVNTVVTK
jgi:hypothetical protein